MRVGIAAVSGAVAAIPGLGFLSAGLLQGFTEAALTAVDGGNLEDVLNAFTIGFVTGAVISGAAKGIRALRQCFVAGTGVLMATGGIKAIENIRVGDMVKSFNSATGKTENKRVLQTYENTTGELIHVFTSDGAKISSTLSHPFYANNTWTSAKDLRAGDILVNVNGQKVVVERIQHEILETPVKVYNFNVDGNHNYYVTESINSTIEDSILVHNVCQKHHVITRKIRREMKNNPNLSDINRNKSSIFTGLTEDAHRGYQKWHRKYDDDMVLWLKDHLDATLDDFQAELQRFYDQPDIVERFGDVIVELFKKR